MPLIKVDIVSEYINMYKEAHYPHGKSRRGFKKWIKKKFTNALMAWVERDKRDANNIKNT